MREPGTKVQGEGVRIGSIGQNSSILWLHALIFAVHGPTVRCAIASTISNDHVRIPRVVSYTYVLYLVYALPWQIRVSEPREKNHKYHGFYRVSLQRKDAKGRSQTCRDVRRFA